METPKSFDPEAIAADIVARADALSGEEAVALIGKRIAPNYGLLMDDPIVRGEGAWLTTRSGKRIFDGVAAYSAANLGHGHPVIKAAIKAFLDSGAPPVLGRFLPDPYLALFGREISRISGFDRFLPANGGVEAPEAAIKLARRWAHHVKGVNGTPEILYCEGCFHGRTLTVTQMLDPAEESARTGFEPWAEGFRRIPFGDVEAVAAAAGPNTAAILVEPIQGEGGINIPPEGYLSDLRKLATEKNFLLILDEVQTGWGRTGEMFRFMHEGEVARPDVLCVGKSLSGGFAPISGILAGDELLSLLGPGSHGSTFGGSPLSSCIALAALAAIEAEDLPAQAKEKGEWLSEQLELIATGSPHVKEIRGAGMMFGIELNRGGPDGHDVCLKLLEIGLLAKDTHRWVIRFTPPVTASRNDLEFAIDALRKGLAR